MTAADPIDQRVRAQCEAGRVDEAAALVLRRYGAEIMGVLVNLAGDEAIAADAYSLLGERVWRGLPGFRYEASLRTWAYLLARRALADVRRALRRGPPQIGMAPSQLPEVVEQARSTTQAHLRTTNKLELQSLRGTLSDDDQLLLVLRLDRAMSWKAIAQILADDEARDDESLRRTAATLRKRFQRVKTMLTDALRSRRGDDP